MNTTKGYQAQRVIKKILNAKPPEEEFINNSNDELVKLLDSKEIEDINNVQTQYNHYKHQGEITDMIDAALLVHKMKNAPDLWTKLNNIVENLEIPYKLTEKHKKMIHNLEFAYLNFRDTQAMQANTMGAEEFDTFDEQKSYIINNSTVGMTRIQEFTMINNETSEQLNTNPILKQETTNSKQQDILENIQQQNTPKQETSNPAQLIAQKFKEIRKNKWSEKQKDKSRGVSLAGKEEEKKRSNSRSVVQRDESSGSRVRNSKFAGMGGVIEKRGASGQRTLEIGNLAVHKEQHPTSFGAMSKSLKEKQKASQLSHEDQLKKREQSLNKKFGGMKC